jgi:methyl-accepting chemotaxis protein
VESACAGEQGRGFAVAASEVRALAQRCSIAAKEIKGLVESSASTVQTGKLRAREFDLAMNQSRESIKSIIRVSFHGLTHHDILMDKRIGLKSIIFASLDTSVSQVYT